MWDGECRKWGGSWGLTRLPWISGAVCRKFAGSPVCPLGVGWGSVSFPPVINTRDADEIRWFEAEENPPLADPQAQFT